MSDVAVAAAIALSVGVLFLAIVMIREPVAEATATAPTPRARRSRTVGQRVSSLVALLFVLGSIAYVAAPMDDDCDAAAVEAWQHNSRGFTGCRAPARDRLWAGGVVVVLAVGGGVAARRILAPDPPR